MKTFHNAVLALGLLCGAPLAHAQDAGHYKVREQTITDRKAVFTTVESVDAVPARARIGGSVTELGVDEGASVERGQVIAIIRDQKLKSKLDSLNAALKALKAQHAQALIDYNRAEKLFASRTIPKARFETARTALEVAANNLKSAEAGRAIAAEQMVQGKVLAPAPGRVLNVPVTNGSIVLPGETIAQIAAEKYILRLELPERHARFIRKGETILIGERGLNPASPITGQGIIRQVYPKLKQGRVIADAEADGIGDYFVGERVRVWVAADKRQGFIIPVSYIFKRYGLDYVKLARKDADPIEIIIQTGQKIAGDDKPAMVEVLAGIKTGDILVKP